MHFQAFTQQGACCQLKVFRPQWCWLPLHRLQRVQALFTTLIARAATQSSRGRGLEEALVLRHAEEADVQGLRVRRVDPVHLASGSGLP